MKQALIVAVVLTTAIAAVGPAEQPPAKQLPQVPLPKGDPLPDSVPPPWIPPNPDKSKHNKRGTDFGPAVASSVQLDKNHIIRRGLTVRLPGDQAVCYDLDSLSVAATWQGGFLDISKTHLEDEKGQTVPRPGGNPEFWETASADHVHYRGHYLHGEQAILSYGKGMHHGVLEMPSAVDKAPGGVFCRMFHVSTSTELRLAGKWPKGFKEFGELESHHYGKDQRFLGPFLVDTLHGDRFVFGVAHSRDVEYKFKLADGWVKLSAPKPGSFALYCFKGSREQAISVAAFMRKLEPEIVDVREYIHGGPPRWKETLTLKGTVGADDGPYVVDKLAIPSDNPWKAWIRPAAIDFFSDGRLAMSSMNGDVWICSGIDKGLDKLQWRRFATGLYEPLGLKIVKDKLYVLGRDRITCLHDLNGDGEADFYESFFAGGPMATGYHAFSFDLQTDSKGNFYFLKSGRKSDNTDGYNALIKVPPQGGPLFEIVATGFRHPNGMAVGPNDEIVAGDNQGEYVPSSKISLIHKGGYYGYGKLDPSYDRPLLWLPMSHDNSSGGQLWAPANWGPLGGKLLHTSYGTCKLFYVLANFKQAQPWLAMAVPLDLAFDSGIMRGRVNPKDGQVYLSGLKGWGTTAKQDGCVARVRSTGMPAYLVKDVKLSTGLRLDFTCKLDPASAKNAANYQVEQWNYIYSEKYGSPEMSVLHPEKKGHDLVAVKSATLASESSVILEIPKMVPVDQLHVAVDVLAADGQKVRADLFGTVHPNPLTPGK